MYELSRIRLHSVGPRAARYQDITIDMREVGSPVQKPAQTALFGDESGGLLRRPSPASVLFTENGNGKSVLIKLIFSVMLPGRKQVVGSTNSKALSNFVLANDVSHVVLEWQHTITGDRLVTGKVAAWRGHVVSADPSKLSEAWYSFKANPGFGLDSLPIKEQNRLVAFGAFRDRLFDAAKTDPTIQLTWETFHNRWTSHLDDLGLDPALFAYQRKMNEGEGEAASAFSFKTDEAFVNWLLTQVTNPDSPNAFEEGLDKWLSALSNRSTLMSEHDFVEGALELLTPLAVAARDALAAIELEAETARETRLFAEALTVRTDNENAASAEAQQTINGLTEKFESAGRVNRRLNRVVLELERLTRVLQVEDAQAALDFVKLEANAADDLLSAWTSAKYVIRYRDTAHEAQTLRDTIAAQEQTAAPALAARDLAATRLISGLKAIAARADEEAKVARAKASALDGQIGTHRTQHSSLLTASATAAQKAKQYEEKIAEVVKAIADAVAVGWLSDKDTPAIAAIAAAEQATKAQERQDTAEADLTTCRESGRALEKQRRAADAAVHELQRDAGQARDTLEAATRKRDALCAEERLIGLTGTGKVILDNDAPTLIERLIEAIAAAEELHIELRTANTADQAVLDALGTGGLLPPSAELEAAKEALHLAGIPAYIGWEYLAQMPERERQDAINAFPALVDGIAVNSPSDMTKAQRVLEEARLLPCSAIGVGTTATFATQPGTREGIQFVVVPNPALYDEVLAEDERARIQAEQDERQQRVRVLTTHLLADRELLRRTRDWVSTYPPGTVDALVATAQSATKAHQQAVEEGEDLAAELELVDGRIADLSASIQPLRAAVTDATHLAGSLKRLASRATHITQWAQEHAAAKAAAVEASRSAAQVETGIGHLQDEHSEALRLADSRSAQAAQSRSEIEVVRGGNSDQTVSIEATESIPDLKSAYKTADAIYERVQVGSDLRADLDAAERTESAARTDCENVPEHIRDLAENLLNTADGATAGSRAAAAETAQRKVNQTNDRVREGERKVTEHETLLQGLDKQEVSLDEYGIPTSVDHGTTMTVQAQTEWDAVKEQVRLLGLELGQEQESAKAAKDRIQTFESILITVKATLSDDRIPDDRKPFSGTVEPPRHVRRLQSLGKLESCQGADQRGTPPSCVSGRSGWSPRSVPTMSRSGPRCPRSLTCSGSGHRRR